MVCGLPGSTCSTPSGIARWNPMARSGSGCAMSPGYVRRRAVRSNALHRQMHCRFRSGQAGRGGSPILGVSQMRVRRPVDGRGHRSGDTASQGVCRTCAADWSLVAHGESPAASLDSHHGTACDGTRRRARGSGEISICVVEDLIARTGLRRDELATLAEIGALNSFGYDRRTALWQIERAVREPGELFNETTRLRHGYEPAENRRSNTAGERRRGGSRRRRDHSRQRRGGGHATHESPRRRRHSWHGHPCCR